MKILIPDIPKEGIDLNIQETVSSGDALSSVRGRLRVDKVGSEIIVAGNLNAEVELQCGRCLRKFRSDMHIPVEVVYHPVAELAGDDRHEITSEDLDLDFYEGDEMDIGWLLREQVALHIPMKPLCDELCRGLCAECGMDLNVTACTCSLKKPDPRFQELKKLLKKRKE